MNQSRPLISIITISLNNKLGLEKTIISVIEQSFIDYEFIIIDGKSSDGTIDILNKYNDKIDYWVSENDNGIFNALNKGILVAKGVYCYFLNSGDYLFDSTSLERVAVLLNQEAIIYGNVLLEKGRYQSINKGFASDNITLLDFIQGTIFHVSAFIRKDQFDIIGKYDETFKICSDWAWFVKSIILFNSSVKYIDELIAVYDLNGISSINYKEGEQERYVFLEQILGPKILEDYKLFARHQCRYGLVMNNKFFSVLFRYTNSMLRHLVKF